MRLEALLAPRELTAEQQDQRERELAWKPGRPCPVNHSERRQMGMKRCYLCDYELFETETEWQLHRAITLCERERLTEAAAILRERLPA